MESLWAKNLYDEFVKARVKDYELRKDEIKKGIKRYSSALKKGEKVFWTELRFDPNKKEHYAEICSGVVKHYGSPPNATSYRGDLMDHYAVIFNGEETYKRSYDLFLSEEDLKNKVRPKREWEPYPELLNNKNEV